MYYSQDVYITSTAAFTLLLIPLSFYVAYSKLSILLNLHIAFICHTQKILRNSTYSFIKISISDAKKNICVCDKERKREVMLLGLSYFAL